MRKRCQPITRRNAGIKAAWIASVLAFSVVHPAIVSAQEKTSEKSPVETATSGKGNRSFYQVLDELLSDFEFDLKSGQVLGLKDLSIREVVTSENIPPSFKTHLELLVTERILKTTRARLVHCAACRSKKTTLSGDSMTITSPENNTVEMQRIAKMNGIANFMDIAFAYEANGMILSLQISDVETGTTLWSRTYNSQSTRASAKRQGLEYPDLEDAKTRVELQPTFETEASFHTVITPKAGSGYSTSLAFGLRMTERYDNRAKEVGFEFNYYEDAGALTDQPGARTDRNNLYSGFNLTGLFFHGWNVYGNEEDSNKVRGMIFGAIGGTYAPGFLGALIRGGYEWKLAKHWSLDTFIGYRPKSNFVISSSTTAPVSGVEGGVGVGFIF